MDLTRRRIRRRTDHWRLLRSSLLRSSLLLGLLAVCWSSFGCSELRGRRKIREGNQLYREGRFGDAVAAYRVAERLIPGFWLLWLNEGLTCRQMMIPGAKSAENDDAVTCALNAFANMKRLRPADARGDQLYVQTLFDADRFSELAAMYQARLRANPGDRSALNELILTYTRWNRPQDALLWTERRAVVEPHNPEAQYSVGVLIWSQLFQNGGGPDMAAFDPRSGSDAAAAKIAPAPGLGDILGNERVRLADLGIAYLTRALAERPKYRDAMVYLSLLYRQKSFAFFKDPTAWQACVDAAERWRHDAEHDLEKEGAGRSP
jgi:tetratricopeptide (TPR) repeat protein